ncbi:MULTISPECIES: SLAP domain-containing protein [unclassified Lactobacillus]|uniref:SLAP domain-containing protein n=1 Tax=unclassified Lactobacillus TaxID=2620435 RepID=UPI002240ABF8|nr:MULTISPECIES: SLAP domain-containing protein [unclassified Lactobacillus]
MKINKLVLFSGVALLSAGILSAKSVQADTTNNLVTKTVMHTSLIYDKNGKSTGKLYKAYQHVKVTSPVEINGAKYYKIGDNQYIKVSNVDGVSRKITHNAYIYATSTKRANKVLLKKGQIISTYGGSFKFKNGKSYYRIGGPTKLYVKAYNLSGIVAQKDSTSSNEEKSNANKNTITTNSQTSTGTIITKSALIYNENGKPFMGEISDSSSISGAEGNKFFRSGTKLSFEGTKNISGQIYYNVGNGMYIKKSEIREIVGQVLLKLKKGSKIYDKAGSVVSTKLPEGNVINYTGKVNNIDKATKYYFINNEGQPQEIPYVSIKGIDYYNLGKSQYVKVSDVNTVNGNQILTDYLTVTTTKQAPLYNMKGEKTKDTIAKNKKIQVEDEVTNPQNLEDIDDTGWTYYFYKLKGEDKLINVGDVDRDKQNPPFPVMYFDENSPIDLSVSFPKDTIVYNEQGEVKYKGWVLPHTNGGSYHVVKLMYIYIPSEQKAELFYEMASHHLRLENPADHTVMAGEDTGTVYVKASDTNYSAGIAIKPSNTPEQAKAAYGVSLNK